MSPNFVLFYVRAQPQPWWNVRSIGGLLSHNNNYVMRCWFFAHNLVQSCGSPSISHEQTDHARLIKLVFTLNIHT